MKSSTTILQASKRDVLPCLEITSGLISWGGVFLPRGRESILKEAFKKSELFVAKDKNGEVIGFYRLVFDGTFLVFGYLHLIAVKKEIRGKG